MINLKIIACMQQEAAIFAASHTSSVGVLVNTTGQSKTLQIQDFFSSLGVHYINDLIFIDSDTKERVRVDAQIHANTSHNRNLVNRYGDKIGDDRILDSIEIKDAGEMGLGIFARESFGRGDFIGEYTGAIVPNYEDPEIRGYKWVYQPHPNFSPKIALKLEGQYAGNHTRFINHSDTPNATPQWISHNGAWRIIITANREIKPGEQIYIFYGASYWEDMQGRKTRKELHNRIIQRPSLSEELVNSGLPDVVQRHLLYIQKRVNEIAKAGYNDKAADGSQLSGEFTTLKVNYQELAKLQKLGAILKLSRSTFIAREGFMDISNGLTIKENLPLEFGLGICVDGHIDIGTSYSPSKVLFKNERHFALKLHSHIELVKPEDQRRFPSLIDIIPAKVQENDDPLIEYGQKQLLLTSLDSQYFLANHSASPLSNMVDSKTSALLPKEVFLKLKKHYFGFKQYELTADDRLIGEDSSLATIELNKYLDPVLALRESLLSNIQHVFQTAKVWQYCLKNNELTQNGKIANLENIVNQETLHKLPLLSINELREVLDSLKEYPNILKMIEAELNKIKTIAEREKATTTDIVQLIKRIAEYI